MVVNAGTLKGCGVLKFLNSATITRGENLYASESEEVHY